MAFSAITTRGSNTEQSSDSSIAVSPSANITVGKIVLVNCVTDNDSTAVADGVSSRHTSVTDTDGNTFTKISEYTDSDGASGDGVTISTWICKVATQIDTTDAITLTVASNVTDKIISIFEVTSSLGNGIGVEAVGVGQSAISASLSGLKTGREYLLLGHGGSEGTDNSKTPDADYTERFDLRTNSSGNAIAQHVVTRIATITSDTCTSTAWTNTNPVFLLFAIYELDGKGTIDIGAKANSGVQASVSSHSYNIFVPPALTNRVLAVTTQVRDNDNPTNRPVTGITAGGVAMTKALERLYTDGDGDDTGAGIWLLHAPATGIITITITYTGTVDHAGSGAVLLFNAKQVSTPNVSNGADYALGNDENLSLTPTVNDCYLVESIYDQDGFDETPASGQTIIAQLGTNGGGDRAISAYKYQSASIATTLAWTNGGSADDCTQVAIAIESCNAIAVGHLTAGSDTTDDADSTTATVAPSANQLILLTVCTRTEITTDPNQPTVTGCGLTWVAVNSVVYDNSSSSRRRETLFRAMGASPSSGALTIDFGGQTQVGKSWVLDQVSGVNTGGTNGSSAVVQSAVNSEPTSLVTTLVVTLASFANANNTTYGVFCIGNGTDAIVAGVGFTNIGYNKEASENNLSTFSQYKPSNDTTVEITFPSSTEIGGIAIEIALASTTAIKTVLGLAKASVKTVNGLAIGSVKSINGLQ